MSTVLEKSIFDRIAMTADISSEAAHAIQSFGFSKKDVARMKQLSAKARAGTLSDRERIEIETYERIGCLLDILHSQARRVAKSSESK